MATTALSLAGKISPLQVAQAEVFSGRYLVAGAGPTAAIVDLETLGTNVIPLGFIPHSFVQNPRHPERVWAIKMHPWEEPGTADNTSYAGEIDLRERKLVRNMLLPVDEGFAGHGFFTPEGNVLFIPRMDIKKNISFLTGYDASDTRKIVADYPLGPGLIHDAQLLQDGTAMVANTGIPLQERAAMTASIGNMDKHYKSSLKKNGLLQIDIRSGKTVKRWDVEDDTRQVSHFAMLKYGNLIAVSDGSPAKVPGKAYYGTRESGVLQEIPFTDYGRARRPRIKRRAASG